MWWAGLLAGLRVGQAGVVFHRPGFGLLIPVPRSLSTQPPFATQALISLNGTILGLHSRDEADMLVYKTMAKCRSSFA